MDEGSMEAERAGLEGYALVEVNHRCTPMGLRDRLALDDPGTAALLALLKDRGVPEALVLATCDRVQICAHGAAAAPLARTLLDTLLDWGGLAPGALEGAHLTLLGAAVPAHVFRVAASLDSQVIGEPHVLGQVKAAHRLARDAGMVKDDLEALLAAAYGSAKTVRAETAIAEGAVSIASAATRVARDLHGDLSDVTLLFLGTQDMGELVVEQLRAAGVGHVIVCAPRRPRAEAVAARLGVSVADHGDLMKLLVSADIVVVGLGGGSVALGEEAMRAALKRRRNAPVLVVDTGIPANVDPGVQRLDAAFLYDLTDLEAVAEKGRASRDTAAHAAEALVAQAVDAFVKDRGGRMAGPAIAALHALFEATRVRALAEAPNDAEKATRLLVGRLLHGPSTALRAIAAEGGDPTGAEALIRRLFTLPPSDGSPGVGEDKEEDEP
jgi:glutamyl-tRNA reductase